MTSTKKKIIGGETSVYVSRSLLRMSTVKDSKGKLVYKGSNTPDGDALGLLVFLDMFPSESYPHLCRYTFVRVNGMAEVVDSVNGPASDLQLELK